MALIRAERVILQLNKMKFPFFYFILLYFSKYKRRGRIQKVILSTESSYTTGENLDLESLCLLLLLLLLFFIYRFSSLH